MSSQKSDSAEGHCWCSSALGSLASLGQQRILPPVNITDCLGLLRVTAVFALSRRTCCPEEKSKGVPWVPAIPEQKTFLITFAEESSWFSPAILKQVLPVQIKRTHSNMRFRERLNVLNCVSTSVHFYQRHNIAHVWNSSACLLVLSWSTGTRKASRASQKIREWLIFSFLAAGRLDQL